MKHIKIELNGTEVFEGKRTFVVTEKYGGTTLGHIGWYKQWKKFAFWPQGNTLYEQVCLRDIANFIEEETKKEK